MTSYEPPTSNLAIFDSAVFQTDNEPLTIAEANKRYLKFPVAQGNETLINATLLGDLTFNDATSISSANMTVVDLNYVSNPLDLTSTNLYNTRFRILTGAGGWDIYIPSTILKPINRDSYFIIENTTTLRAELRLTDTVAGIGNTSTTYFTGKYGSYTTNGSVFENSLLEIAPQSTYVIFIGQTNMFVQQRMSEFPVFRQAYAVIPSVLTTYEKPNYFDTIIEITVGTGTNSGLNLPDARSSISPYSFDRQIKVSNYHTSPLRLGTNSAVNLFGGKYGNSDAEISLPPNTSYVCLSNGTTWEINERSGDNITYQSLNLDLSTTLDYALHYNLLGATHNISATIGGIILYPNPSDAKSNRTTSIIRNVGTTGINIQILGGAFAGKYGRGVLSTVYPLPPNSWIQLYSDGTNYRVDERSIAPTSFNTSAGQTDISLYNYFTDSDFALNPYLDNLTVTIANPTLIPNQTYQITNSSDANRLIITPAGARGFVGLFGSQTTTLNVPVKSTVYLVSNGTDWVVNNRSDNFSFFINPASTTFNWTTDLQYLDSESTFTPPVSSLNPSTFITATAKIMDSATPTAGNLGYIFDITTPSANTISAGSVLSFDNFITNYTIRGQISGATVGGAGKYLFNSFNSTGGTFPACRIRPTGATLTTGTYTQTANQTTFYNTAVFATGVPSAGMTISQANDTADTLPSVPFFVINQNSGTTWNVTQGTNTTFSTATTYFGTASAQVLIPQPSTSNLGRTFKVINQSNNPVNITTSTATNVFGGKYAQIYASVFATPNGTTVNGFGHLLRAGDTVILKSNGTSWETQEGTSFSGTRTFTNFTPTASNATDNTKTKCVLYPLDQTFSNLTGFTVVSLSGIFYLCNSYRFPITINITATVVWASSTAVTASNFPIRQLFLEQGTMDTKGFSPVAVNTTPVPCQLTAGLFVPTASLTLQQTVSGIFTIKAGDSIILQNSKVNGLGAETINSIILSVARVG